MVNNHHAYLYRVADPLNKEALTSCVTSLQIEEVSYFIIPNLGITDVRTLTEKAFMRPQVGERKLIVVSNQSITIEAQHALLKILEEPPLSSVFLFCLPPSVALLPTLLSRFSIKDDVQSDKVAYEETTSFNSFIKMNTKDRLAEITNRLTAKDIAWVTDIKNGLFLTLTNSDPMVHKDTLKVLYFVAENLQTRGASNKHLLEELAFTLRPAAEK